MSPVLIPARSGVHTPLLTSQKLKITNPHGAQTVDLWAFSPSSTTPPTHLSMSHTRSSLLKTIPAPGDVLVSNARSPMLRFLEDTSEGCHDTLFAACDARRYELLGAGRGHRSCVGNLREEAVKAGVRVGEGGEWVPDPWNLFMDVGVGEGGRMVVRGLRAGGGGQYVVLEAMCDCTMIFSACPMDVAGIAVNGGTPRSCEFEVL